MFEKNIRPTQPQYTTYRSPYSCNHRDIIICVCPEEVSEYVFYDDLHAVFSLTVAPPKDNRHDQDTYTDIPHRQGVFPLCPSASPLMMSKCFACLDSKEGGGGTLESGLWSCAKLSGTGRADIIVCCAGRFNGF